MDFHFTDDQRALADTVARYAARDYGFEARRRILDSAHGFDLASWRRLAALGLMVLPFTEADGGLGGGAADVAIVMLAFGRALVLEPWCEVVLVAGGLLAHRGTPRQKARWLEPLQAGDALLVPALAATGVAASREGDGWRLDGIVDNVAFPPVADAFVVQARADHPLLFVVDRTHPGVHVNTTPTHDGHRTGTLCLQAVRVADDRRLGPGDDCAGAVQADLDAVLGRAQAARCAEAVGSMEVLLAQTVEHLRTRRQFGVPLAHFQALQHRLADMQLALEEARAMTWYAAAHADAPPGTARDRALSAATARTAQCAQRVAEGSIQLHGGIGLTDELPASHHFRRLTALAFAHGSAADHVARYSDLMLHPEVSGT